MEYSFTCLRGLIALDNGSHTFKSNALSSDELELLVRKGAQ